jgi:hypothetical protein
MWKIDCHPVEGDGHSAQGSIMETDDWLNWHGDLENLNDSEDDCAADDETDIGPNNPMEDAECPEQQDVGAAPNVPGLVRPTRNSKRQAESVLVLVNAVVLQKNKGGKKK